MSKTENENPPVVQQGYPQDQAYPMQQVPAPAYHPNQQQFQGQQQQYVQPQPGQQQYVLPQYVQPQYVQPQYVQPQYVQPQLSQQQYGHQPPPPMVYHRNDALIAQYEREIAENQIDCSDIFWFLCCGPFGLICCLPKYGAQQRAQANLANELSKV